VELAKELEASLREFFAAGPVEIRENGGRVTPSSAISWEIRVSGENPQQQLKTLIHDLEIHRGPLAGNLPHALYRAQSER
jgi:hypothetical protein